MDGIIILQKEIHLERRLLFYLYPNEVVLNTED